MIQTLFFNVIDKIQNSGKYNLMVNPHYYDRVNYPDRFLDISDFLVPIGRLYDILPYSLCLITPPSTIGLEASYVEVPIIIPSYYGEQNLEFPYFRDGFCVGIKSNAKDILSNIDKINKKKYHFNFDKFNSHMLNKHEASPSDFIANEMKYL